MIIGNGLIAKAFEEFKDDDRYLFFCSGVSNSLCTDKAAFERELNMVNKYIAENTEKKFLYFSTTSIEDPSMKESMYVKHKLEIEAIIAHSCKDYCIFRLSNVVGKSPNKFTVLNFLYNSIHSNEPFNLWKNSNRNLIDIDDVVTIIQYLLANNKCNNETINIASNDSYDVTHIVSLIEQHLNKKADYTLMEKGTKYSVDTSSINDAIQLLNIHFGAGYISQLLQKYYPG
jgi:nucleoside-diphosphate-sugar epimerase